MHAKREHRRVAIGMVDLDNFKQLNDTFGHIVGDEFLKNMSKNLSSILRAGDIISRTGGDEFAIQIMMNKVEDLEFVSDRILKAVSQTAQDMKVTCSLGWAIYPDDGKNVETLIALADRALYEAKKRKNSYKIFH